MRDRQDGWPEAPLSPDVIRAAEELGEMAGRSVFTHEGTPGFPTEGREPVDLDLYYRVPVYKVSESPMIAGMVARAVAIERERCAKIADEQAAMPSTGQGSSGWNQAALHIAARIRSGK